MIVLEGPDYLYYDFITNCLSPFVCLAGSRSATLVLGCNIQSDVPCMIS